MKTKPRQLTKSEYHFLLKLKHEGYVYIKHVLSTDRLHPADLIRAYNKDSTQILDFSRTTFSHLSPLDGKVLITDFLEGRI